MTFITSELKDGVLSMLCKDLKTNCIQPVNTALLYEKFSIDFYVLRDILEIFKVKGLLSDVNARHSDTSIVIESTALDFLEKGGFQSEQQLSELQMQKLQFEVEKLQLEIKELSKAFPEALGRFESLTAIAVNIFTIIGNIVK